MWNMATRKNCQHLVNVSKSGADGKVYVSPNVKRSYLGRYKSVYYVLYIPGLVVQRTNIFLICRVG